MSKILAEILARPDFPEGSHWDYVEFAPGDRVLEEGEQSRDLYLVIQGTVRINKQIDLKDDRHIRPEFGELHAGDVFGELNLFDEMPRSATVEALTELKAAKIDGAALTQFLEDHPELGYQLLKEIFINITRLLRKTDQRLMQIFSWGLKAHHIDQHL